MSKQNYHTDFHPPEGIQLIETETCVNWIDNSIFYIYSKPGLHTLSQAHEQLRILKETFGDKKAPLIVDIRDTDPMEKDTRSLYSSEVGCYNVSAFCFITDSVFSKTMANFFLSIKKPPSPFRMFTSVKEAEEWCNLYK